MGQGTCPFVPFQPEAQLEVADLGDQGGLGHCMTTNDIRGSTIISQIHNAKAIYLLKSQFAY